MKSKEFNKLKDGDKVMHKRYGECLVTGFIPDFGVTINPTTQEGKILLSTDSGAGIDTDLLEDSPRQLQLI